MAGLSGVHLYWTAATVDVKRNIFDLCTDSADCYLAVIEVRWIVQIITLTVYQYCYFSVVFFSDCERICISCILVHSTCGQNMAGVLLIRTKQNNISNLLFFCDRTSEHKMLTLMRAYVDFMKLDDWRMRMMIRYVGSRALSFSGPLLSVDVEFCLSVCLSVCVSAILSSNISKTKGARAKVTMGS